MISELEAYRRFVSREGGPLGETQKMVLRKAAIFALVSFGDEFAMPEELDKFNVQLSDDQVSLALSLREMWPVSQGRYTERMGQGDYFGASYLSAKTSILDSICEGLEDGSADPSFEADSSGVSFLDKELGRRQERAVQAAASNPGEPSIEAVLAYASAGLVEDGIAEGREQRENEMIDNSDYTDAEKEFLREKMAAGRKLSKDRGFDLQRFYQETRDKTGYAVDAKGNIRLAEVIELAAFKEVHDRYTRIVNIFLSRWVS